MFIFIYLETHPKCELSYSRITTGLITLCAQINETLVVSYHGGAPVTTAVFNVSES